MRVFSREPPGHAAKRPDIMEGGGIRRIGS
nr:MAG TPA: hypothetical protein [Caudoviricetes sp.]